MFNRKYLPIAEAKTIRVKPGDWLEKAVDLAREVWPKVDDNIGGGFTLFVDQAEHWLESMLALQQSEQEGV